MSSRPWWGSQSNHQASTVRPIRCGIRKTIASVQKLPVTMATIRPVRNRVIITSVSATSMTGRLRPRGR
ncbi:Uncharacterised protein [Mycobacterium tuberculosis]|uniref:Uncharacterized protein n=1 Tax=Mycobacterium tuberculosis TaxID=1773 RepID=A0A655J4K5_MYCTX|nr:Uncharacterised protein [Mycobacterium tuberculosis]COX37604.1 Uncharacterised protein [Mycobacterium tuberculosis]